MEKIEMHRFVRQKFKSMGFRTQKNKFHKLIGDDYLVGVTMDAGYVKSYRFYCGMIYLPDEWKMPFKGVFDISRQYMFPETLNGGPDVQKWLHDPSQKSWTIIEYEKYTIEQLDMVLDANYEYFVKPMYDKEYGLQKYRDNWQYLRNVSPQKRNLLCRLAGLDVNAVNDFLNNLKPARQVLYEIIQDKEKLEAMTKTADFGEIVAKTQGAVSKQGKDQ